LNEERGSLYGMAARRWLIEIYLDHVTGWGRLREAIPSPGTLGLLRAEAMVNDAYDNEEEN
jgi:hypothetical protein